MSNPKTLVTQFNDLREKRKIKKNTPKGPIDLKQVRQEIAETQKKFRRP